jgi:hypothetical protein
MTAIERGLRTQITPNQHRPSRRITAVFATYALAFGLACVGFSASTVQASNPGQKSAAAQARAAKAEQRKAERAAKREERLAKKPKKGHDSGDGEIASTKAPKGAKGNKQAIDDASLQGGNNDPLEGL